MRPAKYQECFICHKMLDDEGKPADEYAVHGRGSGKVINYFHRSCFYELGRRNKEMLNGQQ